MFNMTQSRPLKLTAVLLSGLFVASAALPVGTAEAHDSRNWRAHQGSYGNWNRRAHRNYHGQHAKKRNRNGELIAAGIIGLAVGAIIASEASKNRNQPAYSYSQPYPAQPTYVEPDYQYDGGYIERQPLTGYGNTTGPNVITYEDTISTEPWTPGWYDYCSRKYRSFNPKNGTFLGYDGQYHFCVAN